MEYALVLGLLYAVQCLRWLPPRSVRVARNGRRWTLREGPGWCLEALRPAGISLVGHRWPLRSSAGRFGIPRPTGPVAAALGAAGEIDLGPGELAQCRAQGRNLWVGNRRILRCASEARAERLAERFHALASATREEQRKILRDALEEALSLEAARAEWERFADATRRLAVFSDGYALLLLGGFPLVIGLLGSERALFHAAAPLALGHLATLVALARASRTLFPQARSARFELLFGALLYPPALLRGLDELRSRCFERFHPAALACVLLSDDERRDALRREILRCEREVAGDPDGDAALEADALWKLAGEAGESRLTLLAAPPRRDPWAQAYCPACRTEYRQSDTICSECRIALSPFSG